MKRGKNRSSRQRGLTLIELMIAAGLAGITSAFLLMITRSQIAAYQMNDEITKAQQNARAGIGFLEQTLRRACGGIAVGGVSVNLPLVTQQTTTCLRIYDGGQVNGGSFTAGAAASNADAVEIIYGTAPVTAIVAGTADGTTTPQITVADPLTFQVGDLVLVGDFNNAALMKIASITAGGVAPQAIFGLGSLTANRVPLPASYPALVLDNSAWVLKAASVSFYVDGPNRLLMFDPDGITSNAHANAQPLVEGVDDFQLAVGIDANADGVITSPGEWSGATAGQLPLAAVPWNRAGTGDPILRQIRATLVTQTLNGYPGASLTLPAVYEDRNTSSYPATSGTPRYRPMQIIVAPRDWALTN